MSILEKIVALKSNEVELNKQLKPIKLLERSIFFESGVASMKQYLNREDKVGIIAEIKRKSPSAGTFKHELNVEQLSISYMQAGASALSVLTDQHFFGGDHDDLITARTFNYCPILRKDFILDEYQVIESKSIGADCILLIASCLTPSKCEELAICAKKLGLEVLLEVHNRSEIERYLNDNIDLIGINNRNLHNFNTAISNSLELATHIPAELIKVSESGIVHAEQIMALKEAGYKGFLIGSHFMQHGSPGNACRKLISDLQSVFV